MTRTRRRVFAGAVLAVLALSWLYWPVPVFRDPLALALLSREGDLLGAKIAADEQWRFAIARSMPDKYRRALIRYEDKRFYRHPGVDPLALARALRRNLAHGRVKSGGSTLSMQVIRLARRNHPRTYLEKAVEILLALRLELTHSKEDILLLYASHAPFGGNIVGLDAAARQYFGRAPDQLSWAESALLAVLPNSPALIHLGRRRNLLQVKRDRLLQMLRQHGDLSDLECHLAIAEPLPDKPRDLPRLAPHFLETAAQNRPRGLSAYRSTLSASVQARVADVAGAHAQLLRQRGVDNLAVLVVRNRPLEVLAYVGNTGDRNAPDVDIIRRPRSTGSILKPFLYAAMLQSGELTPTQLVSDIPTHYEGYQPENFDRRYRGAVRAQEALARSLNVPAVRLLKKYGVNRFYDLLKRCGLTSLFRTADGYGLTLILGGAEASLWDLTQAYANLARAACCPGERRHFLKINTRVGEPERRLGAAPIRAGAAYLALKALREVTRPGEEVFWKQFSSSRPVAWKTGTSYGCKDSWAVGCTPEYTVGVWAGNADGRGVPDLTGVSCAAPVLFDVYNALGKTTWFQEPDGALKPVPLCRDCGYIADPARPSQLQLLPVESRFAEPSPYHRLVHLDASARWQVTSECERTDRMVHKTWFVLPPVEEYYYQRNHADYHPLPPFKPGCADPAGPQREMTIVYPEPNLKIYIPIDLDGTKSKTVFEVIHRNPETAIFWHIDDAYIGRTRVFHQLPLEIEPGEHTLTVVDANGRRAQRKFEVLAKGK